ncbi:MAG: ketoacyl-ACP synthase III [Roseburia sp.]|nr:ketoacyl-ACP synthase III [Roseburia sp.]
MIIRGTGSSVPDYELTNRELENIVDTSDQWIAERTGIRSRHIATVQTTTQLAVQACERALSDAGKTASEVELIIVATVSDEEKLPCTACRVQAAIGAEQAVAYNVNAACAGFLFALSIAEAYFLSGMYRNALIIGAEVLSKLVDWSDRSTCVLFGDGAGAVFAQAGGKPALFVQGSDGLRGDALRCSLPANRSPFVREIEEESPYVTMDGKAVYQFAVSTVPKCVEQVLEKAGTQADEVSCFVLHQANERIIRSVARRLSQPLEKFPMNVQSKGNLSAASIPVLLDELHREGMLKRGEKVVLSGFGAGLTYGAMLLVW